MNFDFHGFYRQLRRELKSEGDFGDSLRRMLGWCREAHPHPVWSRLEKLDYQRDVERGRRWLERVATASPAPFRPRGMWFGLSEYLDDDGLEYADLYYGLMGKCDPDDEEDAWLWQDPRHYPHRAAHLKSANLRAGGTACYRGRKAIGVAGNIAFSISYAALLVRRLLTPEALRLLRGRPPVGVVLGFDGGDLVHLGTWGKDGLELRKRTQL